MFIQLYYLASLLLSVILLALHGLTAGEFASHVFSGLLACLAVAFAAMAWRPAAHYQGSQKQIVFLGFLAGLVCLPLPVLQVILDGVEREFWLELVISIISVVGAVALGAALISWLMGRERMRCRPETPREHPKTVALSALLLPWSVVFWVLAGLLVLLAFVNLPKTPERPPRIATPRVTPNQQAAWRELLRYIAEPGTPETRDLMSAVGINSLEDPTSGVAVPAPYAGYLVEHLPVLDAALRDYRDDEAVLDFPPETEEAMDRFLDFLAQNSPQEANFDFYDPSEEVPNAVPILLKRVLSLEQAKIEGALTRDGSTETLQQRVLRLGRALENQSRGPLTLLECTVLVVETSFYYDLLRASNWEFSKDNALSLSQILRSLTETTRTALIRSMEHDYWRARSWLDHNRNNYPEQVGAAAFNQISPPHRKIPAHRVWGKVGALQSLCWLLYDREGTYRLVEEHQLKSIAHARKDFGEGREAMNRLEKSREAAYERMQNFSVTLTTSNPAGRQMALNFSPLYAGLLDAVAGVETQLTLSIWYLENVSGSGVPDEIGELPVDPSSPTGQRLRIVEEAETGTRYLSPSEDSPIQQKNEIFRERTRIKL